MNGKEDQEALVDAEMKRLWKVVKEKKSKASFSRIDGNNKFKIGAANIETVRDAVVAALRQEATTKEEEADIPRLHKLWDSEYMDTDAMEYVAFDEEGGDLGEG